jgi:hypothetical protein
VALILFRKRMSETSLSSECATNSKNSTGIITKGQKTVPLFTPQFVRTDKDTTKPSGVVVVINGASGGEEHGPDEQFKVWPRHTNVPHYMLRLIIF